MEYFHNCNSGSLHLIVGPMFAGKSSELIKTVRRLQYAKKSFVFINYKADNRYTIQEAVSTHDKYMIEAVKCEKLSEVKDLCLKYDVIGIDEGQFFSDIDEIAPWLADQGKTVVVAALSGTFEREPFGKIHELMSISESIKQLHAICIHCQHHASFTRRVGSKKEIQVIGSHGLYEPVCRKCYTRLQKETEIEDEENELMEISSAKSEKSDSKSCDSEEKIQQKFNKNQIMKLPLVIESTV